MKEKEIQHVNKPTGLCTDNDVFNFLLEDEKHEF